jgi:hypothetical protein
MNRWLLTRLLKWSEKQIGGVSMDYAYHLRDEAPSRLWRYSLIKAVEGNRMHTPSDVYHAAGMAAAMTEDCGPCVQIHVNFALGDGMNADVLRALVMRKLDKVPADIALGFRYGEAIARGEAADELRDEVRGKWGEKGLIELAFTVAVARFYPAVKRGMGYAHTCERVVVNDRVTMTAKAA